MLLQSFTPTTTPAQTFLRRFNSIDNSFDIIAAGSGAGGFNDVTEIAVQTSMNNSGQSAFVTRQGNNWFLTSGQRPALNFRPSTAGNQLFSAIGDNGQIVYRNGNTVSSPLCIVDYNLSNCQILADSATGFTEMGQKPGIDDFSEIAVFYGNLNASGAQTLQTNPGPGIFAVLLFNDKTIKIIRLAGRLIENNSAPGGNDDGVCDPGETCQPGELGFNQAGNPIFFSSFDAFSRVNIAHQQLGAAGFQDDIFTVSFIGTPNRAGDVENRTFSNQTGLWTLATQIKLEGGVLREKPTAAVPVAQIGDVIGGRTLTNITVTDAISNIAGTGGTLESPSGHWTAFAGSTSGGNIIVRSKRRVQTPVVFIPGIGGSILSERQGTTLTERWLGSLNGSDYERLSLAPNEARDIVATDAVRSILLGTVDIYGKLLTEFTVNGGLTEYLIDKKPERLTVEGCDVENQRSRNPKLFVFPYDWRKSNVDNAVKLRSYIQCIQTFYSGTKVDIVAHSMGGLLARNYILSNPSNHSVRKMVTIGSPFLGSPKALYVLETGDFFPSLGNIITARNLSLTSANAVFKRLSPYWKGSHELLPSEAYFTLGGLPFSEAFDFNNSGTLTTYDYPTIRDTFNSRYATLPYETNRVFHQPAQDNWQNDTSGVEYHHLFGRQIRDTTPKQIVAERLIKKPTATSISKVKFSIKVGPGDGTVPVLSAERKENSYDLNAPGVIPQAIFPDEQENQRDSSVSHNGLTGNPKVQQKIFDLLGLDSQAINGSPAQQRKETTVANESIMPPQTEGNYLEVLGVQNLKITDNLGNTNTPINDDFEQVVPDVTHSPSFYDGLYSHNVMFPTDRQYTIKFRTLNESIDIKLLRGIGNESPSYAVRYIDLDLPANVECLLTITGQGMDDLRYDSNGDGTFDTVVAPNVRATGTAAQDTTAPNVTVSYSRRQGSGRVITITANDSQTGVKTIYYRVGETGNFKVYTDPFFLGVLTDKIVEAFADDNVGNRSSPVRIVVPRL